MGDKCKSEVQKPVNNPLLTGAGHGFPFESFQGSSLLVPIAQDSPPVLSDQLGEPDKFVGQDVISSDRSGVKDPNSGARSRNDQTSTQSGTGNQSYVRFFNAFFGGNSKTEEEKQSERETDQKSLSSTSRSFSPYVHVPNFQTMSSALQMPPSASNSFDSYQVNPPRSESFTDTLNTEISDFKMAEAPSYASDKSPPVSQSSIVTSDQTSNNFQPSCHRFQDTSGSLPPSTLYLPEVQAELQSNSREQAIPFPVLSVDRNPDLSKPPMNNPIGPPLANPNAPPLFKDSSKTYRLSHNKRPVYAPIPGLTLSATGTSSFLQSSETPRLPYAGHNAATVQPVVPVDSSSGVAPGNQFVSSALPTGLPQPTAYVPHPESSSSLPPAAKSHNTGFAPTAIFPFSSAGTQVTNFTLPAKSVVSQHTTASEIPSCSATQSTVFLRSSSNTSETSVVTSAEPLESSAMSLFKESKSSANPNNLTASFFNVHTTEESVKPSMILRTSTQAELPAQFPVSPSMHSVPYSSASEINGKQSLFAPTLNKEDPVRTEGNDSPSSPAAVHPTGDLPVNLQPQNADYEVRASPSTSNLAHVGRNGIAYRPPNHHWFYKKETEWKEQWFPFSMTDSVALEQAYQSASLDENTVIPTDGGRYDVNIIQRTRSAVYWEEPPKEARRCSWFYKNQNESRFKPYDENTAFHLEEEYKKCVTTDTWRKTVNLKSGEYIVLYSMKNMAHFENNIPMPDGWEGDFADGSQSLSSPIRMVKRGISDDFEMDDGESPRVDHLVFVVHGIGSVCDLKFRTIEEAVDVFRSYSQKLCRAHFNNSMKQGLVNRIEILPVSWHSHLHGETTGLDKRLESITLKSIPRLRNFTNDTLLDILFYTSPAYCQNIVQHVGREINRIYEKFKLRNPTFTGGVSLVGHSLGSLILFDMLCHQQSQQNTTEPSMNSLKPQLSLTRRMSGFVIGNSETQQPFVEYPKFPFEPVAFFALGSPIGMFITVRGIDTLGKTFSLPTCPRFFNIFHPFDPVAYRIEALINPEMSNKRPVLIPHHKGRKRMHLKLKDTLSRVGADLKQRLVDSVRSTWNTVYQLTAFGRADDGLEQEVDQVIEKQIARSESAACLFEQEGTPCDVGVLNQGRRVDFVLQEAPLESFNEYVSAIRSHLIYWDSEDTILMILREIYNAEGIAPDVEGILGQDSPENNSAVVAADTKKATHQAPGVGWNVTDAPKKKTEDGLPPSYGFINE